MNRKTFIKGSVGLGIAGSLAACGIQNREHTEEEIDPIEKLREELVEAYKSSERMTMVTAGQMPDEHYFFKYTPEAMSFSEQFRHCIVFNCSQLADKTSWENPYRDIKLPVQMPREDLLAELKNFYKHMRMAIKGMPAEEFFKEVGFGGEKIPVWRFFYALENHIVHHRGQAMVYLRLKGTIPVGYVGWA